MKFAATTAGFFFGLCTGIPAGIHEAMQSGSPLQGLAMGLFLALFNGILFGIAVAWFVRSDYFTRQSQCEASDLLPGERVIETHRANLIVSPQDFGCDGFACDDLFWLVGMKDRDALGGSVHLTNYRLFFKTHRINRLRGCVSVFLPTIRSLQDESFFLFKKATVHTFAGKLEFVVHDTANFIANTTAVQSRLTEEDERRIADSIVKHWRFAGEGLRKWRAAETLNRIVNLGKKGADLPKLLADPLGTLTTILLRKLIEKASPLDDLHSPNRAA